MRIILTILLLGWGSIPSQSEQSRVDTAALLSQATELMKKAQAAGRGTPDAIADYQQAIELLKKAAESDAKNATPYVLLAQAYLSFPSWPALGSAERIHKVYDAAKMAVNRDPNNATAHLLLGVGEMGLWHWSEADNQFRRAPELDTNNARAHGRMALYLALIGRTKAARAELEKVRQLNPGDFYEVNVCLWLRDYQCTISAAERWNPATAPAFLDLYAGVAYLKVGRLDRAIELFRQGVEHSNRDSGALLFLAYGLAAAGQKPEAAKITSEVKERISKHYVPVYRIAAYEALLGNKDEAFRWLDIAADPKSPQYDPLWLDYLKADPLMDPLRPDRRFTVLLQRIGFPR